MVWTEDSFISLAAKLFTSNITCDPKCGRQNSVVLFEMKYLNAVLLFPDLDYAHRLKEENITRLLNEGCYIFIVNSGKDLGEMPNVIDLLSVNKMDCIFQPVYILPQE